MPIPELDGFEFDVWKDTHKKHSMSDEQVIRRLLKGETHFWVYDDQPYLFARSKCYGLCASGCLVEMADLTPYIEDVRDYPHRVEIDAGRAAEAIEWATEHVGLGASLHHGENDEQDEARFDHVDDLSSVVWAVARWPGFGLAMTVPAYAGEMFEDAPEIFFFRSKEKAALFRMFMT
jgi:hypothetical protein